MQKLQGLGESSDVFMGEYNRGEMECQVTVLKIYPFEFVGLVEAVRRWIALSEGAGDAH